MRSWCTCATIAIINLSVVTSFASTATDKLDSISHASATVDVNERISLFPMRAVLLEDDPNDPAGQRHEGLVIWHTKIPCPLSGRAFGPWTHADIAIPHRNIAVTLSLGRDSNPAARPASVAIEVFFRLPADNPRGGVRMVAGLFAKPTERARPAPIADLVTKVANNIFLIHLSRIPLDLRRNSELLKEKWLDLSIIWDNGDVAVLSIENYPFATQIE